LKFTGLPEIFTTPIYREIEIYVMKYPIGLALIYMPFFFIGHIWALLSGYPADGFSFPYQFCIAFGSISIAIAGLAIMRKVLLRYFSDIVVCMTLIALVLGTNYFNYATTDGAMPHNYVFTVFALIIYLSIRQRPFSIPAMACVLLDWMGNINIRQLKPSKLLT
jgi:hypothetical protein